ncbi:hypothetical protein [Candidatus Methylacidiphilum infernorum]|nr:hypothetical protein [Candidatus Methylacidiphilum infernorum]
MDEMTELGTGNGGYSLRLHVGIAGSRHRESGLGVEKAHVRWGTGSGGV